MERPLHSLPRNRNELVVLARALLYAEQSVAAHAGVLAAAFVPEMMPERVQGLAGRTLAWTTLRPQPRARTLAQQLRNDASLGGLLERHTLRPPLVPVAPRMRLWPGLEALPRLETVGDLATWLRIDLGYLLWFADLGDRNHSAGPSPLAHYSRRALIKPGGAVRLIEAPKQHLKHVQRQILREILTLVPQVEAAHGYRRGRSTLTFAVPHTRQDVVLRLDLRDFFPTVTGPRVQALFRTLGYPEGVADLLGGLCTTSTPRGFWRACSPEMNEGERQRVRTLYARPHLPQGAPTSPVLANLCARRLDRRLTGLAEAAGGVYTRYADDLAFSGTASFARSAGRFALHAAALAAEEGFAVQHRKTRLMRRSVRQHLAGLTVNARPNLPRREWDTLEAMLLNCVRHGPATQNRAQHPDFRAFLAGKVAYAAMVNPKRAVRLRALLEQVRWA